MRLDTAVILVSAAVMGLSAAHPAAVATTQAPLFVLPAPTGPSPVGTTSWHVTDETRPETFAATKTPRQVKVVAWYPGAAGAGGARAPYLREGLAEIQAFASLIRAGSALDGAAGVQTHALLDAPPAARPAKLPVLVFSHGYAGIPSAHAALFEDLASHGYAVLSIAHPYEATAVVLSDGTTVSMLDNAGAFRQGLKDVIAEWATEDATMASVTSAMDDPERLRVLRTYLAGLRHTKVALDRWVADTRLVLDRLSRQPAGTPAARLSSRLDLDRVGALGHSMGGVTAGQFCVDDRRCRAALNLDGIPQYGTMIDKPFRRPFLMVYSSRPGRTGASDAIYERAASPYYRTDVRDTLHLDFTDMVFWGAAFGERKLLGAQQPSRTTDITRALVREYFDQELLGRPSPLLSGKTSLPELIVSRFSGAKR